MQGKKNLAGVKSNQDEVWLYADESCHLENDGHKAMVMGVISCKKIELKRLKEKIRALKKKHRLKKNYEIKWTKVSSGKENFYLELVQWFFAEKEIAFRGVVIPDKTILAHHDFAQTHDQWYYKMYFQTLRQVINRQADYRVFIDIKDTRGGAKVAELAEILSQGVKTRTIKKVAQVRSEEALLLQVTDVFIGALGYFARGGGESKSKTRVVQAVAGGVGYPLGTNAPRGEKKFNCLFWQGQEKKS